jgi:hypothetical protein
MLQFIEFGGIKDGFIMEFLRRALNLSLISKISLLFNSGMAFFKAVI